MKFNRLIKSVVLMVAGAFAPGLILADDIEVYGADGHSTSLPNVLFIIDVSGSMRDATDGEDPSSGELSKLDILQDVLSEVLDNSAGKINAGLLYFNDETSGIKWPISDLNSKASAIDPDLPVEFSNKDALKNIVKHVGAWDRTNYVSALTEAVQYFSGDEVWLNNWGWQGAFVPPKWQSESNRYSQDWPEKWTPIPASYSPQNAFQPGSARPNPAVGQCWDLNYYTDSNYNECEGEELVTPLECTYSPPGNYTSNSCDVDEICNSWDNEGGCTNTYCPDGHMQSNSYYSNGGRNCKYNIGTWETPNYVSPIASSCQKNYIILLSDGLPTINFTHKKALNILGLPNVESCENMGSLFFDDASYTYGNCAAELVEHLATTELVPSIAASHVNTYTIGFGLLGDDATKGTNFLTHLASKGGGEFFAADSYESLVTSFSTIIDSISGETDDFGGISVGVRNSSFSNDNRAFLNVFKPSSNRSWLGNLKGYFVSEDGLLDLTGSPLLNSDGTVKKEAQSFWSQSPDGAEVSQGGFSSQLVKQSRNLYTYTGSGAPNNVALKTTAKEHQLAASNSLVTTALLGVADNTARTEILDWVNSAPLADPLHTKPVIAKYASGEVIFTMTNLGFIHAVDAENPREFNNTNGGNELYAFIPPELLANLNQIKTNLSTGSHIYGLDGEITVHHNDDNSDGIINSGELARLYIGMRRGGSNYYALDISNKTSPKLLWQISGGEGDFADMGQSWSRMLLTTLKSGSAKDVLIFGGGYDVGEDAKTSRSSGKGNRVYIVDAATGEHIWSVGSGASGEHAADMIYSVPSDITAIDINGNGFTDHLYFGDMGGQLWRVKFEENLGASGVPNNNFTSNASVQRIADFGASANRKFFYAPSVSLMSGQGENYLAISIGSGNRAHPLNKTVEDMVFMIRDPLDTTIKSTLLLSDLYDATNNLIGQGSDKAAERAVMQAADGWYMKLGIGEKSLSKVLVYDRKLRFTTYQPTESVELTCSATNTPSKARYYVMNLGDATPASDSTVDESELTKDDRAREISVQGIASEPKLIFPPDGNTVEVYVGKENVSTVGQSVKQIYWKQVH